MGVNRGRRSRAELTDLPLRAVMIDLSHTADDTARQALSLSQSPVFFSHSGARSVYNHTRNLPDDILKSISEDSGRDSFV